VLGDLDLHLRAKPLWDRAIIGGGVSDWMTCPPTTDFATSSVVTPERPLARASTVTVTVG